MKKHTKEDYIKYRLNRAAETIKEIESHIESEFWNTTINRMYYACFYAVNALLYQEDIQVYSHNGIRQKFGEHFVKTNKFNRELAKHFTDLSQKRNQGDYNDFFDFDKETVLELFPKTVEFIEEVKKLIHPLLNPITATVNVNMFVPSDRKNDRVVISPITKKITVATNKIDATTNRNLNSPLN